MYIRKVRKTDPKSGKTYFYHQLEEAYRTPNGPRQRTLLNLGRLSLRDDQLKYLADRIEQILTGQLPLFEPPEEIEKLARHFASLIRKKKLEARTEEEKHEPHWEEIDVNSVKNEDVRTVGAESVGAWAYKELGITEVSQEVGFNKKEIDRAKVMIIGKLVNPGSEKEIYEWFSTRSGLDEVMDIDLKRISLYS